MIDPMPYKDPEKQKIYHYEYRKYRRSVPKRVFTTNGGVWECEICGASREDGAQLDIHHKDQDSINNAFENLSCLCSVCHRELHTRWYKIVIPNMVTEAIRNGPLDWRDGHVID